MLKVISLFVAALSVSVAQSQEIATCRSPVGHAYYHYAGLTGKSDSGWSEDKITKGIFSLTRGAGGVIDILFVDIQNKPISTTQDGGVVRVLRKGSSNITVLVYYPEATTEIYSFFKEKDDRFRFTLIQNKTGDQATIPKSSVMVGSCDHIRFDLMN